MTTLPRGLISYAATDLLDVDGRAVAEVASPLYSDATTELAVCPYADLRKGGSMNRSALRQMTTVWPELLAALRFHAGPEPTVHQAWRAAVYGISGPLIDESPTPRATAALFKTCLGLSQVFSALLLSDVGVADVPLTALGSGEAFFAELDSGKWLIGASQVCAGSSQMIIDAFNALAGLREVDPPSAAFVDRQPQLVGAPTAIGLHIAHLLSLQNASRNGDGPPITSVEAPWLRAVFAIPNRPIDHVRRLFPADKTPQIIETYLASPPGRQARIDAFEQAIASLEASS